MSSAFGHVAAPKNDDSIAVVYRTQPVRDEDTRSSLFFKYAVDVLQQSLLRMCVKRRSLIIKPVSEF